MATIKVRTRFSEGAFQAVAFCSKSMNLSIEDYIAMCTLSQTQQFISAAEQAQKERQLDEAKYAVSSDTSLPGGAQEETTGGAQAE